jgi:hypothetical protein
MPRRYATKSPASWRKYGRPDRASLIELALIGPAITRPA